MNPKLRAVLFPILAALAGALAAYFGAGCTPAQIDRAESAADLGVAHADCVLRAVKAHDTVLVDPTPQDGLALALALRACHRSATADAGVN